MEKNYFCELNNVNVNNHVEKKNGLSYVSWPYAWAEVKKRYPDATYTIYENAQGWNYHTDGSTCWVKTGLTVNGIEHIEYLPVMDYKNASIRADKVTSFDVNKAIQRSLTKAAARHGLGLYIYAGEDLPEEENQSAADPKGNQPEFKRVETVPAEPIHYCEDCTLPIKGVKRPDGSVISPAEFAAQTKAVYDRQLCRDCQKKAEAARTGAV